MPFEKGNKLGSGRPKIKPWTEALRVVANENDGGKKRLRRLAEKTFEAAMEGDIQAVKEIGNRLEGTPVQSVDVGGAVEITQIRRVVVDPSDD